VCALADKEEEKTSKPNGKRDDEVPPDLQDDGLDALDKTALLELAKKADLKIHHASGEDKIRAALREAKKADQ
jgi:hypothetical protein